MSVPEDVERIVLRRSSVRSVFLRYKGSQLRKVRREGVQVGSGTDFSGEVSGGAIPCISDILDVCERYGFMKCAKEENE